MKILWCWLIPLIGLGLLIIPAAVFLGERGSGFLIGRTRTDAALAVFPLVGLYAFTLLWIQLMLGSLMPWWRRLWPRIETWHRVQGVFVFLFAVTHPVLLLTGIGLERFQSKTFLDESLQTYLILGQVALLVLSLTVLTALLRKLKWVNRWWRSIHFLNYPTFLLVWFHAWNLGSDVQTTGLRWVWIGYGLTFVAAVVVRLAGLTWPRRAVATIQQTGGFVPVAKLEQIQEGQPFCAQVNGQAIALFRFGSEVYALNNACNHAGGSLCQGHVDGEVIECPLHYSRFNVKTGAHIDGPATRPQVTYAVRIQAGEVQVAA